MVYRSNSQQAYTVGTGTSPTTTTILDQRDPTSNDIYYSLGTFWINQLGIKLWYLNSQSNASGQLQSTWEIISITNELSTLSGDILLDVATPSLPSDSPPDNIQLIGANGITVTRTGTHQLTISNATEPTFGLIPDAHTAPGTSPVVPNGSGNITLEGGIKFATGTQANPIRTNSLAANTIDLQIQLAGSNAATATANNFGVSQFDSNSFTVASGFVTLTNAGTTGAVTKLIGDDTLPIVPTLGAIILDGVVVANGAHAKAVFFAKNATSIEELDIQVSAAIASTDITKVGLSNFKNTQFSVDANGFVSLVGGTGPSLLTESDDVGTLVSPSVTGNIQLVGHVVEQGSTKFSTTVAGTNLININPMSSARWIVDPLGFNGTHTTIASAITSATSGDTILILPGTYTENLTLKAGVNLAAFDCDALTPNVTIVGKATFTAAGTVTISGIRLTTNSDFLLAVTGSAASIVNLENCYLNISNNTGISHTSSNATSTINCINCSGNIGTTGIAVVTSTSAGNIDFQKCDIQNTGGSSTVSTVSTGVIKLEHTNFYSQITTSSVGSIAGYFSIVGTSNINATGVTLVGTGTGAFNHCNLQGGSASAASAGAGTNLELNECIVASSNTNAIDGLGSIVYVGVAFSGSSSLINVTTQTPKVFSNNAVKIKSPGSYPYTTIPQDAVILVDTSSARTIIPLASPTTGQMHRIKDSVGSAAANNITITPSGKNIDGAASSIININYGSVDIVYNGSEWSLL